MKDFESAFREFLKPIRFQAPAAVVISNVEARPYTVNKVATLLSAQLTSPVKWVDSIQYLEGLGVETFREVGPGTALTGMVSRIRKGRKT